MLVVASFIQHVVFQVKDKDVRLKELALKHCNLHLNVGSPDLEISHLNRVIFSVTFSCIFLLILHYFKRDRFYLKLLLVVETNC